MSGRSRIALAVGVAALVLVIGAAALSGLRPAGEHTATAPAEPTPAPAAAEPAAGFRTTSPLFEADWLQTDDARCPEGTSLRGAPPPGGNEVWCARPDGTRHGQHIHWQSNGRKAFERRYKDGTLHGYWAEWQISGKPWTVGQYKDGKRHGRWMRWNSDSTIRVTEYDDGTRLRREVVDERALAADDS